MRSIAVLNQKGGTGKTTTTVNLAAALGETGQHVLVVDMDPQGGATRWFGIGNPGRGVADIFINNRPLVTLVRSTDVLGVSVVPASPWLNGAEKGLAWEPGAVGIFRRSLDTLPPGQWEFLLVDCPPALNL
ncbi:MAG: AAA family ATPase, partial [Fidelibacterota bacterium]